MLRDQIDPGVAGLVLTLLGMIAAVVGVLVRTTWRLATILERFNAVEQKLEKRAEDLDAVPVLRREIGFVKELLEELGQRVARHNSDITELRVRVGAHDAADALRRSQGDFDKG